jgi:hypothetical protein
MYNPLIAVNKNINMIAVVSSGMFFKKYLSNPNGSINSLSAYKGDGMTILNAYNAPTSYYSQDLLYYIKDGYTVTKREKIFQQTRSAGEIGSYEYDTYNGNILSYVDNSPIVHSISIIAVGCYFVLCGYNHRVGVNLTTANNYIIIVVYNSRGEYISSTNYNDITLFYPKLFNGFNNSFWLVTNAYSTTGFISIKFSLFDLAVNGTTITNSKEISFLYTNSVTSPNIFKNAYYNSFYIASLGRYVFYNTKLSENTTYYSGPTSNNDYLNKINTY